MRAVFQYPFPVTERKVGRNKVVSARAAVELIRAGDTLATGGFVGVGFAEEVAIALEERFSMQTRRPRAGRARWGRPTRRACIST